MALGAQKYKDSSAMEHTGYISQTANLSAFSILKGALKDSNDSSFPPLKINPATGKIELNGSSTHLKMKGQKLYISHNDAGSMKSSDFDSIFAGKDPRKRRAPCY